MDDLPDFSPLVDTAISMVYPIDRGRNSRVYKVVLVDGCCCTGKAYHQSSVDPRDRLGVEFQALSFLRKNGVDAVPRAIACDVKRQMALYEYIDGTEVTVVSSADIQFAVSFLNRLKEISGVTGVEAIGKASAACFSVAGICEIIDNRLQGLLGVKGAVAELLHDFLQCKVRVFFERVRAEVVGADFNRRFAPILSPSDFGFHNCIRRKSGTLAFVDFEYFGFDDPAKLLADFLLHPGMAMGKVQKTEFLRCALDLWPERQELQDRVQLYFPFIGLVWCLICLNEFLDDEAQRRHFATGSIDGETCLAQLAKSKMIFNQVEKAYDNYPY